MMVGKDMTESSALDSEGSNVAKPNPSKTLHYRIARFGYIGWAAAFLFFLLFVLQSLVVIYRPTPVAATDENGQIAGYVVWNDVIVRDDTQVVADIKRWVSHRLSLNAETVYEDAEVALNHMCESLQEETMNEWFEESEDRPGSAAKNYLKTISDSGGISKVEFDKESAVDLQTYKGKFNAVVSGSVKVGIVNPEKVPFKLKLSGDLKPYSDIYSLGLEVCKHEDI